MTARPKPKLDAKRWRTNWDGPHGERGEVNEICGELDEMCIGEWLHAERLDHRSWFVSIGPHCFWLKAKRDGTAEITMHEVRQIVTPAQRRKNQARLATKVHP